MIIFICFYVIILFIFIVDMKNVIYLKKRKLFRLNNLYINHEFIDKYSKENYIILNILSKISVFLYKNKIINIYGNSEERKYLDSFGLDYGYFLAIKICSSFVFLLISILIYIFSNMDLLYFVLCLVSFSFFGFKFPNFVFNQKRKRHFARVEVGVADTLDLFLVCAEAGLAMESAMECVAVEMLPLNKDIAYELNITINEMRIGNDRVKILEDLGKRTGLVSMQRLSGALIQTFETGSSLVSVLRVLVSEIREDSLIKFEEKAAKLSIILTFPMIIFLLPCMFIIIAGPAILGIVGVLKN